MTNEEHGEDNLSDLAILLRQQSCRNGLHKFTHNGMLARQEGEDEVEKDEMYVGGQPEHDKRRNCVSKSKSTTKEGTPDRGRRRDGIKSAELLVKHYCVPCTPTISIERGLSTKL